MAPAVIPPSPTPINPGRIRMLNTAGSEPGPGPIVYWMFRDQRSSDNWALLHALHLSAVASAPVAVAFNLFPRFLGAHARQFGFMLRGLRQLSAKLRSMNIPFFLFRGEAADTIPKFVRDCGASVLVTDFSPLRPVREQKEEIVRRVGPGVGVHEVDAHNVVPVWAASGKLEYSARTIRAKINRLLPEYLVEFPETLRSEVEWIGEQPPEIDWDSLIAEVISVGEEVPEIRWCEPGEDAALEVLVGSNDGFLTKRLRNYHTDRNSPLKPKALSGVSPYLHYGQISAQMCALKAKSFRNSNPQGAWEWARNTLMAHAADKREHIYTKEQLEKAKTYDHLWNASQLEMVYHGKMHGFMRMYWAKKILEWTSSPEEALSISIYLNDKYEIDGRDPNGYVGCMWSICGVHDQGWKERPVFGKIRYMNYAGCKRKFDVDGYIGYVNKLVGESRKRKSSSPSSLISKQSRTEA